MIRGKTFLYLLGLVLLTGSCSDPWETRFEKGGQPDQTVWQMLSGNGSYSKFRDLLEETGGDTLLQRNTSFTVFVVPDDYFPDLTGLDAGDKAGVAKYHLSNFILYSGNIVNGLTLKTLNGKRLTFTVTGEGYMVNYESLLLRTNLIASNGVIHEIDALQQVRPNLLEYLNQEEEYSYIADFFAEGTEVTFDRDNSVPIGIDEDGQTIYDSVWKQSNVFFTTMADLGSEDAQYTFFLASNELLDTVADGSYKSGYISNLANFIIDGVVFESELPGTFRAVNGFSLDILEGNYMQPVKLSNGWAYAINGFQGMRIPGKFTWEITEVSDFDSIRNIRTAEYASLYDRLQGIKVSELSGTFINLKYDFDPGALNGDYLKIVTESGTTVKIGIHLPDLLPAKYLVRMGGVLRATGGLAFDAYMNGELIGSKLNMNGGDLTWKIMDIGETTITSEKGNILTLDVTGGTKGYIDYLSFEPVK